MSSENGDGAARSFEGPGFGTMMLQVANGRRPTPAVASSRAVLRGGLPAVYQDGDFGMRFIGALETVLDPIVAILDALPAHFSPDHAPRDVLSLLAAWLGADLDESRTIRDQREVVRQAAELGRRRGTRAGIQLALQLSFPELPLRVEDGGGVRIDPPAGDAAAPPASFVVYCDVPIGADVQAAVARTIERHKPVQATYRLRVRQARTTEGEAG